MSSKSKKEAKRKEALEWATVERKRMTMDVRRGVTSRAFTSETKCTMQLRVHLSKHNEWFLHQNSCRQHCYHPHLEESAKTKSEQHMSGHDKKLVSSLCYSILCVTILFDTNIHTTKFSLTSCMIGKSPLVKWGEF